MKTLVLLCALFVISCADKSDPFPVKVTDAEFLLQDENYTAYLFTLYNDGDTIIDSFKVDISIYENGLRDTQSKRFITPLMPYQMIKTAAVFSYHVEDLNSVYFKYKFK